MIKYSEFRPTTSDPSGLGLDDRQDWLVLGVSQNRDSDCLDQSNFDCALKELGGESDYVEVHRFRHWGPGWIEIILIKPTAKKTIAKAEDIERALADYPILDDEDYSRREYDEAIEIIEDCSPTLRDDRPEDWASKIFNELNEIPRENYSCSDKIEEICWDLGFVDAVEAVVYDDCDLDFAVDYCIKHNYCEDLECIMQHLSEIEVDNEEENCAAVKRANDYINSRVPENQLPLF